MTNKEVAEVLEEIANVLEIQDEGEPPGLVGRSRAQSAHAPSRGSAPLAPRAAGKIFKIRSYRRAAEVVAHLPFAVESHPEAETLVEFPGIGKGLAEKIVEIAQTGTCTYRNELLRDFPTGLLEVIRVPSVGPKKAALFHRELGVNDVQSLELAARAGRLASLPGMGKKSEEKILAGIEQLKRLSGRILLSEAQAIAQRVISHLPPEALPVAAGSLRRGRESIGDIDILVSGEKGREAMVAFLSMRDIDTVLVSGETKSSVILKNGVQVDLRVVPEESMGAACQYFTGSKEHNIRLREIASARGWTLNEYGLFDPEGRSLAGRTEEEIYQTLGMAWVPPELREDAGEIDAAQRNELPELIELGDIRGDLHCHTTWSDGANSIEEMAAAARARGWEYLAICDHSKSLGVARGLDEARVFEQIDAISRANQAVDGIAVLAGTEVDVLSNGELDLEDNCLAELDVVVASVHTGLNQPGERFMERTLAAVRHEQVDVLGHPTGRIIGRREASPLDVERVLEEAARSRTAVEVNAFPDRTDLGDVHIRMAREMGAMLVINTDAHATDQFDVMWYGVNAARRGWARAQDVLNTGPLSDVRKWLRGR